MMLVVQALYINLSLVSSVSDTKGYCADKGKQKLICSGGIFLTKAQLVQPASM